ncbi:hypothetical protein Ae406Ps2_3410 [Pseudonocardia sp. Ae406_Ps2]|nr:hypothetical protein Ae406Ps2_3410 [Pseudonocardia sp. Ae406_Ps2]
MGAWRACSFAAAAGSEPTGPSSRGFACPPVATTVRHQEQFP